MAPPTDADAPLPLGRPRLHLRLTASTNERARELAIAGAPHGTLVTAAEQSAGRGRQGRRWSAPAGSSILMSLVLREPPPLLPLMAAVAVCDVVGEQAQIKWPNDIVLAADSSATELAAFAKLAGILIEGRPQEGWAVLGIGLNVAVRVEDLPSELRPGEGRERVAATMGESPDRIEPLLARLLDMLEQRISAPAEESLQAWRARDALKGRAITWSSGHGVADGIDGEGRLVVALDGGGHKTLGAGEVHLETID